MKKKIIALVSVVVLAVLIVPAVAFANAAPQETAPLFERAASAEAENTFAQTSRCFETVCANMSADDDSSVNADYGAWGHCGAGRADANDRGGYGHGHGHGRGAGCGAAGTGYVDADGDGVCDNYEAGACGRGAGVCGGGRR